MDYWSSFFIRTATVLQHSRDSVGRKRGKAFMSPIDSDTRLSRRRALGLLGFAGAAFGAGCASPTTASSVVSTASNSSGASVTGSVPTGGTATTAAGCVTSPEETAGPYPDRLGM